jgi:AcrR family transcriptional regulator
MKPAEKPYHHGDLRIRLIQLASIQLAKGGVKSVSLRKIAAEVPVSHTAAYSHFSTKEMLIAAVLTQGYEDLTKRLKSGVDNEASLTSQLVQAALLYYSFSRDQTALFLAMTGPRLNAQGTFPELEAALGGAFAFLKNPIAEIEALLPLGEATAPAFSSSLQGFLTQLISGRIRVHPDREARLVEDYANALCRGLGIISAS